MNEKSIDEILAERQLKEFNESKFGQFFNNQKLKEQELTYLNNKALDIVNEEDLFEIMSLIPQPFITEENKNVDVLSLIYNNFLENTEIPLTLPIFSFLSFLSAFCVKNEITYTIPLSDEKSPLDTWITILAPSGSAKSRSAGIRASRANLSARRAYRAPCAALHASDGSPYGCWQPPDVSPDPRRP